MWKWLQPNTDLADCDRFITSIGWTSTIITRS